MPCASRSRFTRRPMAEAGIRIECYSLYVKRHWTITGAGYPDHLIRPLQERRRDRQAEGSGGLEVDDQVECGGFLDREVGWLGSPEYTVDVHRDLTPHLRQVVVVGEECSSLRQQLHFCDERQAMLDGECSDLGALVKEKWAGNKRQTFRTRLSNTCEHRIKVIGR